MHTDSRISLQALSSVALDQLPVSRVPAYRQASDRRHPELRETEELCADYSHLGQRHDELATAVQKSLLAFEELVEEVPGEREVVVRLLRA